MDFGGGEVRVVNSGWCVGASVTIWQLWESPLLYVRSMFCNDEGKPTKLIMRSWPPEIIYLFVAWKL